MIPPPNNDVAKAPQATPGRPTTHSGLGGLLSLLAVIVPLAYYPLAAWLAVGVVSSSTAEAAASRRAAAASTAEAKSRYAGKWLLEGITFGYYEGASLADADYEGAIAIADDARRRVTSLGWSLAGLTAAFVGFAGLVRHGKGRGRWRYAVRHATAASLVLFAVGVTATAVSLVAYREVPVMGQVIFKYESKGIAEAISRLFDSGNLVLGSLVLLFSIVIPLVKAALLLAASTSSRPWHDAAVRGIHAFGKWSMADVFVVAVLLAIFALGSDATTDAHAGAGLYFFTGYCLLSITAAAALEQAERRPPVPALLDWRQWRAADGSREQEAAFVAIEGGIVRVLTRGGRRGRLDLSCLCQADRDYVSTRRQAAAEPLFEPDD
jgi:paraquat-inducible protein A